MKKQYKPLTKEQIDQIEAMKVYSPKMARYANVKEINFAAKLYNDSGWNVFVARHRYHNSDDLSQALH